ncbi:MAG: molybdate ABC transporter substrate-binding protein [Methanobrevibacter sp.]|uniref:molybdate ABC transporter substrate-binding protein n=1 Tax=Methanobrevibacter sp. TaxID=66852 RepID=UPI0026E07C70|nr:molybdate ABC transporter substrate-binding protein [Methanobrevibacter sp.]MDO5849189.1 molybdate ABC transporter substrate-binding protein [Methanobrevibacter sp.]
MKSKTKIIIGVIIIIAAICIGYGAFSGAFDSNSDLEGQTVDLAAAASLKNVFDEKLIPMFEKQYPGVKVKPVYASSGDLQTQIENGLETDVFMSASNKQMNALAEQGIIDNDTVKKSIQNKLVLIVPADSNTNITSFEGLKDVDGTIAIGDPDSVPAGQYAKEALTSLGVWDAVQSKLSLGNSVTAVLNQVADGSAEYGLVYTSDADSNDKVKIICDAPEGSLKKPIVYPIGIIKDAKDADAAEKFVEFLQSQEAQDIFKDYGFTIVN